MPVRPLAALLTALAALGASPAALAAASGPPPGSVEAAINDAFAGLVEAMAAVLFFPIAEIGEGADAVRLPAVVAWLAIGAVFFTVRLGFVNVRLFRHALTVVSGRYDNPKDPGDVSHFQALTTALSATVGLGNIAGVAVALMVGGPGATFWLIAFGLFSMSTKYLECSLGVKYRVIDANGHVQGGPMRYLREGLARRGAGGFGHVLAVLFAVLCVGASFGGGNMFQVGQSYSAVSGVVERLSGLTLAAPTYGIVMVLLTGLVIIGGVKSIARVADKIVPVMVVLYLACVLVVLFARFDRVPDVFAAILSGAFTPEAGFGGFVGVLIQGVRRAVFSNEAGIGSAAVAHAAARTKRPVREGTVALLEPFVDTVVVCTLTATAILLSGALGDPGNAAILAGKSDGTGLTMAAFGSVVGWFPEVIGACVFLFAFSTVISWSYYGERSFTYLFGVRFSLVYKVIFLGFVYLGAVSNLGNVIDFSDMMILAMSVPNMLGLYILSGEIARDTRDYVAAWRAGDFAEDEAAARAAREEVAQAGKAGADA